MALPTDLESIFVRLAERRSTRIRTEHGGVEVVFLPPEDYEYSVEIDMACAGIGTAMHAIGIGCGLGKHHLLIWPDTGAEPRDHRNVVTIAISEEQVTAVESMEGDQ